MCAEKILIHVIAIVAVVGTTAVVGAPVHEQRSVDLHEAVNRTLCPFVVELDDVPGRVPQQIKHVKCVGDFPRRGCMQRHTADPECCGSRNHLMECVQLYDTIAVRFPSGDRLHTVSVGCACMKSDATPVDEHRGPV